MKLVVVMKYSFVPQNSIGVITARMDTKLIIMKTEIGVRCNTGSNISKEQRVIFYKGRAGNGIYLEHTDIPNSCTVTSLSTMALCPFSAARWSPVLSELSRAWVEPAALLMM